jgi:Uma2 family endonuclease
MATATLPPPVPGTRLHLFTVADYHRMQVTGIIAASDRVELIRGVLVEKPVMNPPHAASQRRLVRFLPAVAGDAHAVQFQLPITLADSEPEPDAAFVAVRDDDYGDGHPRAKDVSLVIEIADSTLAQDRGSQLELYAENKIAVYWIVNLVDGVVEVYTQPKGGKMPTYRTRTDYAAGESVPVVLGGKTVGQLPVSDILPGGN